MKILLFFPKRKKSTKRQNKFLRSIQSKIIYKKSLQKFPSLCQPFPLLSFHPEPVCLLVPVSLYPCWMERISVGMHVSSGSCQLSHILFFILYTFCTLLFPSYLHLRISLGDPFCFHLNCILLHFECWQSMCLPIFLFLLLLDSNHCFKYVIMNDVHIS